MNAFAMSAVRKPTGTVRALSNGVVEIKFVKNGALGGHLHRDAPRP